MRPILQREPFEQFTMAEMINLLKTIKLYCAVIRLFKHHCKFGPQEFFNFLKDLSNQHGVKYGDQQRQLFFTSQ